MATPVSEAPTPPTVADLPDRFTVESAELRAEVSARTPISFTTAGEPYIPLPAPFERFYLGVMRRSDVPHDVAMMVGTVDYQFIMLNRVNSRMTSA
jgi:hypothetical protein